MTNEQTIHQRLIAPFDIGELKFYPGAKTRDGKSARVFTYIDARAVMDRLDAVIGPENWSTSYRVMEQDTRAVECTLTATLNGFVVQHADVGYPNDAKDADNADKEPLKAAYSEALKRAAVQLGIGRYIYSLELERDYLPIDQYGKFTEKPTIKGSAPAPRAPRPAPTETVAQREMTTAAAPKPTFWDVTAQMGYSRERVTAFSQEQFNNREPAQLTTDERKRLVLMLEDAAKKEPVSA